MPSRLLSTTCILSLFLLSAYFYTSTSTGLNSIMSSNPESIPLTVTIKASESSTPGTIKLKTTIKNTSPSSISILRWNSPLVNQASMLGIYHFTSASTGEEALGRAIKPNYRLPPSGAFSPLDTDIENISGNDSLELTTEFKRPIIRLEAREKYKVVLKGQWQGVWTLEDGVKEDVRLSMKQGMNTGDFESNEIEVLVPGDEEEL